MPENHTAHVAQMTTAEAARLLKTTPATIRRRKQAGLLPSLPSAKGPVCFALADVLALANREWPAPPLKAERHVCLLVHDPKRFSQEVLVLVVSSLAAGKRVVLALDDVQTRLGALLADPRAQRAYAEDRLRAVEAATVYLNEGRFDEPHLFQQLSQLGSDDFGYPKSGRGGQPLVILSEMSWAAGRLSNTEVARFEAGLNQLLFDEPLISLVCVYDASRCNGETVLDVLQNHPAVWIDGARQPGFISEKPKS